MRLNTRLRVAALFGSAICGSGIAAGQGGSEPVQVSSGASNGPQHRPIVPDVAALPSGEKLVVWLQPMDEELPQRYQLCGRAIDRTNAPLRGPIAMSVAERDGHKLGVSDAAIQRTQRGFLVLWGEGAGGPFDAELVGMRLRADGEPAGRRFSVAARGTSPALAYNPERRALLAVWTAGGRQIRASRLRADGSAIGKSFRLWRNPDEEGIVASSPSVAYDPQHDRYLAVWSGAEDSRRMVLARTVSADLNGRLGRTTRIGPPRTSDLPFPDVAFSPRRGEFLLASHAGAHVLVTRIDSRGRQAGKHIYILHGSNESPASFPAIGATRGGDHLLMYSVADTEYYRRLGPRLRIGPARRVWTGPRGHVSSGSGLTTTSSGFGLAWVQALGPDDDERPQFHYADREVFFRELSARR